MVEIMKPDLIQTVRGYKADPVHLSGKEHIERGVVIFYDQEGDPAQLDVFPIPVGYARSQP